MLVVLGPAESHFNSSSSSSPFYQSAPTYSRYRRQYDADYYEFLEQRQQEQEAREYAQYLYEKQQRAQAVKVARERQEAIARLQAYYEHRQRQYEQAQARARLETANKARYMAVHADRQRCIAQAEARHKQRQHQMQQQQRHEQRQQAIAKHIFASILAAITQDSDDTAQDAAPAVTATSKLDEQIEPAKPATCCSSSGATAPLDATSKPAVDSTACAPVMTFEKAIFITQTGLKRRLSAQRHVSAVRELKQKFDETKSKFVTPSALVFDNDKSAPSAPVLAYSSDNKTFRGYEETLTKLLVELDTVETEGSQTVRAERKALAVAIEEELTRLDEIKANAWAAQNKSTDESAVASADLVAEPSKQNPDIEVPEKGMDEPNAVHPETTHEIEDSTKASAPDATVQVDGYTVEAPTSVHSIRSQAEQEDLAHLEDIQNHQPAEPAAGMTQVEDVPTSTGTTQPLVNAPAQSEQVTSAAHVEYESSTVASQPMSAPGSPVNKVNDKSTKVSDIDEDEDVEVSSESSFELLE